MIFGKFFLRSAGRFLVVNLLSVASVRLGVNSFLFSVVAGH